MADHIRNQIRDRAVVAVTSLSTTGANVFQSPVLTPEEQTLPALLVYIDSEVTGFDGSIMGGILERQALLHIDGYVESSATVLDTLDLISKEVETAVASTGIVTAGGASLVQESYLQSTDIEISIESARPLGVIRLAFFINYRTATGAPDVVV